MLYRVEFKEQMIDSLSWRQSRLFMPPPAKKGCSSSRILDILTLQPMLCAGDGGRVRAARDSPAVRLLYAGNHLL